MVLPLDGIESGHKGFTLGVLEALTSGLACYGRADGTKDWGATVYVQVQNIQGFSGESGFKKAKPAGLPMRAERVKLHLETIRFVC